LRHVRLLIRLRPTHGDPSIVGRAIEVVTAIPAARAARVDRCWPWV
jgi:hypothetical protein